MFTIFFSKKILFDNDYFNSTYHCFSMPENVWVFTSPEGFYYIVSHTYLEDVAYVFTFDPTSGNLVFSGVPFLDVFPDCSMAVTALNGQGFKLQCTGDALIGILVNEDFADIGIIDKIEETGRLPGNHIINTVRNVKYIHIPKNSKCPKTSIFKEFQVNNNHYYCDTYDMTNLFPNDGSAIDEGFVWNKSWRKPFEDIGMQRFCINLIQGVVLTSNFKNSDFNITYVARRSVMNPGTRYFARGLNDLNQPGNEVECELIFVKNNEDKFWTVRWRRGSIPIRWKTILSSKISAPKHCVDSNYFEGTSEYFQSLQKRFGSDIPIRIISLLDGNNNAEENSEIEIKTYFRKALERLDEVGIHNVYFTPFDLNRFLHSNGTKELMVDFVSFIGPLVESDGFNFGTLPLKVEIKQKGLMRFNCADSLDRTNVACFYYAVKLTAEWCLNQKIGLSNQKNVDSNHPYLSIHQEVLDFIISSFVTTGNVVSFLYTNTPAIKSNAICCFSSSFSSNATSSDSTISIQRRLQNVVNDPQRMKIIEYWTKPPKTSNITRIDSRHLYMIPLENKPMFPRGILGFPIKSYELSSEADELTVCLPFPMKLFSFLILLFPVQSNKLPYRVILEAGMNLKNMTKICTIEFPIVATPTWCRYRIKSTEIWENDNDLEYVRFVRFTFKNKNPTYVIGNIKIEAISFLTKEVIGNKRAIQQYEYKNESKFKELFESYLCSERKLKDLLDLEKSRIIFNVSKNYREKLSILNKINPWSVDPEAQLLLTTDLFCSFCCCPFINGIKMKFSNNNQFPGLINQDKNGGITVCEKCYEEVKQYQEICESIGKPLLKPKKQPDYSIPNDPCNTSNNQNYTTDSSSVFLNLDSIKGLKLKEKETKMLSLFIVQQAIIIKMCIESTSPELSISLVKENEVLQKVSSIKTNSNYQITFSFNEPPILQILNFKITANVELEVQNIRCLYTPIEFQTETHHYMKPQIIAQPVPNSFTSRFYPSTRTEEFNLPNDSKLSKIQIQTVIEKGKNTVLLIFVIYKNKQIMMTKNIMLPDSSNDTRFLYNIDENGIEADTVIVYYRDISQEIKQQNIKLILA